MKLKNFFLSVDKYGTYYLFYCYRKQSTHEFLRIFITVSLNNRDCLNFYDYMQPFARFYLFLVFIFIYPLTILYSKACVGLLFPKYHATVS